MNVSDHNERISEDIRRILSRRIRNAYQDERISKDIRRILSLSDSVQIQNERICIYICMYICLCICMLDFGCWILDAVSVSVSVGDFSYVVWTLWFQIFGLR